MNVSNKVRPSPMPLMSNCQNYQIKNCKKCYQVNIWHSTPDHASNGFIEVRQESPVQPTIHIKCIEWNQAFIVVSNFVNFFRDYLSGNDTTYVWILARLLHDTLPGTIHCDSLIRGLVMFQYRPSSLSNGSLPGGYGMPHSSQMTSMMDLLQLQEYCEKCCQVLYVHHKGTIT